MKRLQLACALSALVCLGFLIDEVPGEQIREAYGLVFANVGGQKIPLVGATVSFEWLPLWVLDDAPSDADGAFRVPLRAEGGRLCARASGFVTACVPVPDAVDPDSPSDARVELVLAPLAGVLTGRVTSADGHACYRDASRFGSGTQTEVELRGGLLGLLRGRAQANRDGQYVMAPVLPGSYEIVARCAGARVSRRLSLGLADIDGTPAVDLEFANLPPRIEVAFARDASGRTLRAGLPGQTVTAVVRAVDPNGDALVYRFVDDTGTLLPTQGASASWRLSAQPARNLLSVEVSDGRGGFAQEVLELPTGEAGARFSGRLSSEDGVPLPGVQVRINGVVTQTDAHGEFRAVVPETARYALTVQARGHMQLARVFDGPALGLELVAAPLFQASFDPDEDFVVTDPTGTVTIEFFGHGLVGPEGESPVAPVTVGLGTYGPSQAPPGDGATFASLDNNGFAELERAFYVEFHDARGVRLDLDSESGATAVVAVDRALASQLADTLAAADFDDSAWRSSGSAVKVQELSTSTKVVYRVPLVASAAHAVLGIYASPTCLRVKADRESIVVPLRVALNRYVGELDGVAQYVFDRELEIPDYDYHALPLRPNSYYQLIATPGGRTGAPFAGPPVVRNFYSPASNPFGGQVYPYETCAERHDLLARRLPPPPAFLSKATSGTPETAQYHDAIGATAAKATIEQWKTANGFNTKQVYSARFYNMHELGLGREIHCVLSPLACYIRKYGKPGGPVDQTLDDMVHGANGADFVAIDTLAASPGIGFYTYGPDGKLKPSTWFDSQGEKTMPGVCIGCHGSKFVDGLGRVPAFFVPVDPGAHIYPAGPFEETDRAIKLINEAVAASKQTTPSIRRYIDGMYGPPSYCPTPPPPCEDVPPGTCPPPPIDPPDPPIECRDPEFFPYLGNPRGNYANFTGGNAVFDDVIHPFCVLCHMSRENLDWSDAERLRASGAQIRSAICDRYVMPHTFNAFRNFWQGPAAIDKLMDFVGQPRCPPYVPKLSIQDQIPPDVVVTDPIFPPL